MGVGSWGQGATWILIHGTGVVDRSLKVLFFGLFLLFLIFFSVALHPKRGSIVLFFGLFLFVGPSLPGNFSAKALE